MKELEQIFDPRQLQVPRRQRDHRPGELNLKSCELLNPSVEAWIEGVLPKVSATVAVYPTHYEARHAVSDYFSTDEASILLTPGSEAGIALIVQHFGHLGPLIIAKPHFEAWSRLTTQTGRSMEVIVGAGARTPGLMALHEPIMRSEAPIVVVTQPDGWSGSLHSATDLQLTLDAVSAQGGLLVVDTCYHAYTGLSPNIFSDLERTERLIQIHSFSKSHGLAGARVGAIRANPRIVDYLSRGNIEGYVSGISQRLLCLALDDKEFFTSVWEEIAGARARCSAWLSGLSPDIHAQETRTNFTLAHTTSPIADNLAASWRENGIRVKVISDDDGAPAGLRISTPSHEAIDRLIRSHTQERSG